MFGVTGTGSFGPPQNSDVFAVDDTLSELEKCKRYVVSKLPLQRFVYVKCLASCAREIGIESTIMDLLPLLDHVLIDAESFIRKELGDELAKLTFFLAYPNLTPDQYCLNKDGILEPNPPTHADEAVPAVDVESASYQHILMTITPAIQRLIGDSLQEVRQSAGRALAQVAAVLHGDDVGKTVLTLVLCLAHAEGDEQRTTAVFLMNELAPQLGQILCQNFIALELAAFADDSTFRVRKATAQSFGNVCQTAGADFTVQKLLPPYLKLSKDLIWGVRKGCVDSMVSVAKVVPASIRTEVFIPMFERFANDTSRWVRNGAFEVLGAFLHTLGSEAITKEFVQHFTNIPTMSDTVVDQEVKYFCAFNFPAVACTLGKERWEELAECFLSLTSNPKFQVRKCMACSLHEIAAIIGEEAAEKNVLPQVDRFLKDISVVRTGVIKNLAAILKCVPHAAREPYLTTMWNLQNQRESQQWRWRWHLARQMGDFINLYSLEIVTTTLRPLLFEMCNDSVAAVRREACSQVGSLLARLSKEKSEDLDSTVATVVQYAMGESFVERQTFIRCCQGCSSHLDSSEVLALFDDTTGDESSANNSLAGAFWRPLHSMAEDRVPNTRTALAECLIALIKEARTPVAESLRTRLATIITALRGDVDLDVKINAHKVDLESCNSADIPTDTRTVTTPAQEPQVVDKLSSLTDKDLEDMGLVEAEVDLHKSSLFDDDDDDDLFGSGAATGAATNSSTAAPEVTTDMDMETDISFPIDDANGDDGDELPSQMDSLSIGTEAPVELPNFEFDVDSL